MEDQPVVFLAVNSGNSSSSVKSYLDRVNVKWPAIVDRDRKFEAACRVGEISLRNIWQTRVITPKGALRHASVDQIGRYLKQAKWNLDPTGIPIGLKPTWRALEFGDVLRAASLLTAAREKVNATDAAFVRLKAEIDRVLVARVAAADALVRSDRLSEANVAYRSILRDFDGYRHEGVTKASSAIQRLLPGLIRDVMSSLERSEDAAFDKLRQELVKLLAARLRSAGELVASGRRWEATKAYEHILFHYDGLAKKLLREAKSALRELKKNDDVKNQLAARRSFDRALENLQSSDPKKQEKGKADLVKLCKSYPGTEAAGKAQAILSD